MERDKKREESFFKKLTGMFDINGEYIFVHQDPSRGFIIKNLNRRDIQIIDYSEPFRFAKLTNNIFDYLLVLERAKEIHCVESSFLFIVDSFNFKGALFNHRYARSYPTNNTPTLRNDWKILNESRNPY